MCPGFIDTPILVSPIRGAADRARLRALTPKPMPPAECARAILGGVEKNRATIVVTAHAKALWYLARVSPDLTLWVAQKVMDCIRALRDDSQPVRDG